MISPKQTKCEVCCKKGSCTGRYCFVGRTVATLSDCRPRRSNHGRSWLISSKLGQQAGATAKAVFIAAERPRLRTMTEVFDALSVVGDPVPEDDRVVHLLASLPESYSMLVTALEANAEVPKMELVTERLLHEERKLKDREGADVSSEKAMTAKQRFKKGPKCHHCGKYGHIRRIAEHLHKKMKSTKVQTLGAKCARCSVDVSYVYGLGHESSMEPVSRPNTG